MNRERTCINTDKEIWRKIKDDFYSPSIHITEKGGIGINVGGRVIVLPVEKWHELADRITAEENQLQNKEPIFYDCTLAKFAEQMNVPLYKAMEFGKYFRIIAEEGKDNLMLTERIAQITAHRVCCGSEHNPQEGKFHGYCVVCGVPFPCEYVGVPPTKQPQQPKLPTLEELAEVVLKSKIITYAMKIERALAKVLEKDFDDQEIVWVAAKIQELCQAILDLLKGER